jgi:hypothetical protein
MATTSTTTTTTKLPQPSLSESIQQSLPQLYDTPLKRILDYTTDPITKGVTAHYDNTDDDDYTLRSVVLQQQNHPSSSSSSQQLPSVGFVIRRPG